MGLKASDEDQVAGVSFEEYAERFKQAFAAQIRRLGDARGGSVRKIGAQVGVSGASISNWGTGKTFPEFDNILKIAWTFGVKPGELFLELTDGGKPVDQDRAAQLRLLAVRLGDSQIRFLAQIPPERLRAVVDALKLLVNAPRKDGVLESGASILSESTPSNTGKRTSGRKRRTR